MDGGLESSISKKLVWGVGTNDADYTVQIFELDRSSTYRNGNYKSKIVWLCPFYSRWKDLLKRCYSAASLKKNPSYRGCTVCEEWLLFSNFRKWMIGQNWEGMQLDKDILFEGNKIYSPETSVFVTSQVNTFLLDCRESRGEFPIGVTLHNSTGKYVSRCGNPFTRERDYLGLFICPQEAHNAWLCKKLDHAYSLAALQDDPRVAKALIDRYENYKP